MPSWETRFALQTSAGAEGSLAQQVEGLDTDKITQAQGDARYVLQDVGSAWTAATGTLSRAAYASYAGQTVTNPPTQAEVQAIDDAVVAMSQAVVGLITDLKANGVLT